MAKITTTPIVQTVMMLLRQEMPKVVCGITFSAAITKEVYNDNGGDDKYAGYILMFDPNTHDGDIADYLFHPTKQPHEVEEMLLTALEKEGGPIEVELLIWLGDHGYGFDVAVARAAKARRKG